MSNIDPNIKTAERLDTLIINTNSVVENALEKGFNLLANSEDPQAILDVFGTKAVMLFSQYEGYRQLMTSFGKEIEPTSGSYEPQADGTVIYTAPVIEED